MAGLWEWEAGLGLGLRWGVALGLRWGLGLELGPGFGLELGPGFGPELGLAWRLALRGRGWWVWRALPHALIGLPVP